MYWYTYPLSVKIIHVCFMQIREKKTELTVNDNPGSVLQDPIERIEEDASSTYFIDKEGTIPSAGIENNSLSLVQILHGLR